ncbi:1742_t:CDS:2, partial [Racocetra persica]
AIDQANVIFANSDASKAQQNQTTSLIPQYFTILCSVTTNNLRAAAQRSKFGEIWGLVWQAIQLAVEYEDNEIEQWLKSFINQKNRFLAQNKKPEDSEKENNSTIVNPLITSCGKTGYNSTRCQEKGS